MNVTDHDKDMAQLALNCIRSIRWIPRLHPEIDKVDTWLAEILITRHIEQPEAQVEEG